MINNGIKCKDSITRKTGLNFSESSNCHGHVCSSIFNYKTVLKFKFLLKIETVKLLCAFVVSVTILIHTFLPRSTDESCNLLLESGHLLSSGQWQPYGCLMKNYTKDNALDCLQQRKLERKKNIFVFVGDSRLRRLYDSFSTHTSLKLLPNLRLKHADRNFTDPSTGLRTSLVWLATPSDKLRKYLHRWEHVGFSPSIVVMGFALHPIRDTKASQQGCLDYKNNITTIIQELRELSLKTRVLWFVQPPLFLEKWINKGRMRVNSNKMISEYNDVAKQVLRGENVSMWQTARDIASHFPNHYQDAFHPDSFVYAYYTQILLNYHCNYQLTTEQDLCCSYAPDYYADVAVNVIWLLIPFVLLILSYKLWKSAGVLLVNLSKETVKTSSLHGDVNCNLQYTPVAKKDTNANQLHLKIDEEFCVQDKHIQDGDRPTLESSLFILFKLVIIFGYMFLLERTQLYRKESITKINQSTIVAFALIVIIVSLIFTRKAKTTAVLSDDIIREWKGGTLAFYGISAVASPAFQIPSTSPLLHPHGGFLTPLVFLCAMKLMQDLYAMKQLGAVKFVKNVFTLNLTTLLLCLVMNQYYHFYYLTTLLTFTFIFVYSIMSFPPKITCLSTYWDYVIVCVKIAITIVCLAVVANVQLIFQRIWMGWFIDSKEYVIDWWINWRTHQYSIIYGLIVGVILCKTHKTDFMNVDSEEEIQSYVWLKEGLLFLIGVLCMALYCQILMYYSQTIFIGILLIGYIILRHSFSFLRNRVSTFLSFLGEHHLEVYLCYLHIIRSQHGPLIQIVLPGLPTVNLLLTSLTTICIAHELKCLTVCAQVTFLPVESSRASAIVIVCATAAITLLL